MTDTSDYQRMAKLIMESDRMGTARQPSSKERLSDANLEYHAKSGTYDIASMAQELIERRRNETLTCAKFRIGDDVVVTRWHAPAKVKGFIYELEEPFQYPERERDLSPPAQKATGEQS